MNNESNAFISCLKEAGVSIVELTFLDEEGYKREWFSRVVPEDKRQKATESNCFDTDGCSGYLWHVFSYNVLEHIEGVHAKKTFDKFPKQEAILLANWGDVDNITSCRLKNISNITATDLDILHDVILTDINFEWTYAKTHEKGCGPYFHWIDTETV